MECDFDQLLEMFVLMGRNGLDTTQPLKWQFFFMGYRGAAKLRTKRTRRP